MDSFYDIPRSAPVPTRVDQISVAPTVPEVSLLCTAPKAPVSSYASYNTWRNNRETSIKNDNVHQSPKYDYPQQFNSQQQSFSKKQVRFQSPMQQQRPSLTYEPFTTRKRSPMTSSASNITSKSVDSEREPSATNQFHQIYMANIPNRQLDLSIIDVPAKPLRHPQQFEDIIERSNDDCVSNQCSDEEEKENSLPRTYRDFLEMQKSVPKSAKPNLSNSVTDVFNYRGGSTKPQEVRCQKTPLKKKFDDSRSTKSPAVPGNYWGSAPKHSDNVLSYKNSVDMCGNSAKTVLNARAAMPHHKYSESRKLSPLVSENVPSVPATTKSEGSQTSVVISPPKSAETAVQTLNDSEPSTRDLLKIIAQQNEQLMLLQRQVATLLTRDQNKPIEDAPKTNYASEKCVTSTQNEHFKHHELTPRKRAGMSKFSIDLMTSFEVAIRPQGKSNYVNCEPKIQEITESESVATSGKYCDRVVDQSLQLKEPVEVQESCPSPEPSININMNDYDSSSDDEVSASEIGATFYNNLMGQVNNILKQAQMQTKEDLLYKQEQKPCAKPGKKVKTLNRVKEATLKHLQSIGINVHDTGETSSSASYNDESNGYSPTEISFAVKQLLMKYLPDDELAKIQARTAPVGQDAGFVSPRPDFSFASVQYMKKYNLLPTNEPKGAINRFGQKQVEAQINNPKILDMTALKMQPKLL